MVTTDDNNYGAWIGRSKTAVDLRGTVVVVHLAWNYCELTWGRELNFGS